MGFFHSRDVKQKKGTKSGMHIPVDTLRKMECAACPLANDTRALQKLRNPKMEPSGSSAPFVYLLGEYPGSADDNSGKHFSGKVGRYLDKKLPSIWRLDDIRWNNCVRCAPPPSGPNISILSCCAPSIERDIEQSAPWAIIGFGNVTLKRLIGRAGIHAWRGRRIPVKIGDHVCWYFPLVSPADLMDNQRVSKRGKIMESDWDKVFARDLQNIEDFYQNNSDDFDANDYYESPDDYLKGVNYVMGNGGKKELHKVFDWLEELEDLDSIGIDIEATSLRPYNDGSRILTVSVGTYDRSYAFPVDHPKAWGTLTSALHARFKKFLLNSGKKIAHNLNFEQEWFSHFYGDEIIRGTEWGDTMAQAYTLNSRKGMLSLDDLVLQHMGFSLKALYSLDKTNMIKEPLAKVLPYNALDTKYTYRLWEIQNQILSLRGNRKLIPVSRMHIRTSGTIVRMQKEGLVPIWSEIKRHKRRLGTQLRPLIRKIAALPEVIKFKKIVGRDFNYRSNTDDVVTIFRDILKRKEINNSEKKKGYSVDEAALKSIPKSVTELPSILLEIRSIEKLKSTYVDSIEGFVYSDGLMHPNYNDKYTSTGRLSCEDPNNQNWPKKKHKEVRSIIGCPPGFVLLSGDYGQIEARVIAMASQDDRFVKALWEDLDIHMDWTEHFMEADESWLERAMITLEVDVDNTPMEKMVKAARGVVKNRWVFPRFFGAADNSCAAYMDITEQLSKDLGAMFWEEFRGVKEWQDSLMKFYAKHGYVETLTGRRRSAPVAYNEIINTPIQGCLQGSCRIHTDEGLIPISDLVGKDANIWTGHKWASARVINRGQAQLAQVSLSSGIVINCDTRHKLKDDARQWVDFTDLKINDYVALPSLEFPLFREQLDWFYLLGAYIGDGSFYVSGKNNYSRFSIIGGESKKQLISAIYQFLAHEKLNPRIYTIKAKDVTRQNKYSVSCDGADMSDLSESFGVTHGKNAFTKEIPETVWRATAQQRFNFLSGLWGTDGSKVKYAERSLHMCNESLLMQVQLLCSSIGIDSALTTTDYGYLLRVRKDKNIREYPSHILYSDLGGLAVKSAAGDCQSIAERYAWKSGKITQPVAKRIYDKYVLNKEFYRYDKIVGIKILDVYEDTYTLSVDDEMHQFVADGVIHKNTASDIVINAMNECSDAGFITCMNVHDDLTFRRSEDAWEDDMEEIAQIMCFPPFDFINVPVSIEFEVGTDWANQKEVHVFNSNEME